MAINIKNCGQGVFRTRRTPSINQPVLTQPKDGLGVLFANQLRVAYCGRNIYTMPVAVTYRKQRKVVA